MPWVKAENAPRNIGAPVAPPAAAVTQDLAEPGFGETIGAAWRSQNIIGSTINNKMLGADLDTVDPDFDPFEASKGTRYEEYPERLSSIFNRKAYEAFTAQVDMEDEDRRTLDAAGGFGILAQVGAGIMDPTILIPAGSLIRSGKVGYSLSRSALSVGTGAAVGVGVQEGVLQSTQETRTATESALAIGGGAILGAMVGVAGAKILDNVAWNDLSRRLSADLAQRGPLPIDINDAEMKGLVEASRGQLASAGAAAVTRDTIDALSVAGRAAQVAVGPVARLNPLLRALSSPSARTREIMLSMMENPVYIKKNFDGGASAQSVETYVKEAQARYTIAFESTVDEWTAARKAGAGLPKDEFRRRIGQAMRNNDVDPGGNEFVTKAAQRWRKDVFDPLKKEAVDAGLLPEGIEAGTAPSYFHRMYNTRLIEANEKEFRQIVRDWARESAARQMAAEQKADTVADSMSPQEVESYIEDIVESIFSKITGRTLDEQGENPFRIVATRRGPLKERTFNIEDAKIAKFLEDDIEIVGRRYTRVMGADVELSRMSARLGGSGKADLADLTDEIRKEYAELRKGAKSEREIRNLADRERNDIRDMNAVRDMLRGSYLPEQNSSGYARIINAAMTFNYMRALGGVVVSSMSDIARPLMVHGLGRYMNAGIKPLVTNLKAFRLSAREAKLSGVVGERVRNAMLATYAELTDPYARSSPFERFLDNAARGFSRLTGMPVWNDFMKSFSAVITQDRILGNAAKWAGIKESERAYMQFLGIDQSMAERIARQFAEHGETLDGVRVAHTDEWTDEVARRFYRAAVNKDVDSIIVTKGVGDVPLFAKTPTGRALLQFKGFALASHQRALVRGLQEDKLSMLSGLIAMTAIGSFIYYLKSVESNRWGDLSDNPGRFLAEGLDRSGFLSIPFEVNNTAEKIGAPGVYTGLQALFPDAMQKQPASRYAVRSVVDAALGPSVGLAKDVLDMAGAAARADLSSSDVNTMRRLTPGASLPIIRSLIEYGVMPEAKEAVQ